MTANLYTTTFSNLNAQREIDILNTVMPNGIVSGMAPFVKNPDDIGSWTVSLSSGKFIIDGTIVTDSAEYTSLWDLSSYGVGGTNPGGGKYFLLYAEYKYDRTNPVPVDYRFVHGDFITYADLTDRGNATYDPWSAYIGHETATAIPLAEVFIPDAATSIDDVLVTFRRAELLSNIEDLKKTSNTNYSITYDSLGVHYASASAIKLKWSDAYVAGLSPKVELDGYMPSPFLFSFPITGSTISEAGANGTTYINELDIVTSTGGGLIVIRPSWTDRAESLPLEFLPFRESLGYNEALMGDDNGWIGDESFGYRPDLGGLVVVGVVLFKTPTNTSVVSLADSSVHICTPTQNTDAFGGVSNIHPRAIRSTVYGTKTLPDIDGLIDIDSVITNLTELSNLGLDEVYDSTVPASPAGNGRAIDVDGGAVELTNKVSTAPPLADHDVWNAALRVNISEDESIREYSERGLEIAVIDVGTDLNDYDFHLSKHKGVSLRQPLYLKPTGSGITIGPTSSVDLAESGTTPNRVELIDADMLTYFDTYEGMSKGRKIFATFALDSPYDTDVANFTHYEIQYDAGDGELYLVHNEQGYDDFFLTTAHISEFGGLAAPLTAQSASYWIEPFVLRAEESYFYNLNIIDDLYATYYSDIDGTGEVTFRIKSSDTNSVRTGSSTLHETNGTIAAGYGVRHTLRLQDDAGGITEEDAGAISAELTDVAQEYAATNIEVNNGGGLVKLIRLDGGKQNVVIGKSPDGSYLPQTTDDVPLTVVGQKPSSGLALYNITPSNTLTGRDSYLYGYGRKADSTETLTSLIRLGHDSAIDDYFGAIELFVNNNSSATATLSVAKFHIDANGDPALEVDNIGSEVNGYITFRDPTVFNGTTNDFVNGLSVNNISPSGAATTLNFQHNITRVINELHCQGVVKNPSAGQSLTIDDTVRVIGHVTGNNSLVAFGSFWWAPGTPTIDWLEGFGLVGATLKVDTTTNTVWTIDFDTSLADIDLGVNPLSITWGINGSMDPAVPVTTPMSMEVGNDTTTLSFRIMYWTGAAWVSLTTNGVPPVGTGNSPPSWFEGVSIHVARNF